MTLQARYTIRRKIADGGTAEIFLATQHGAHGFEKTVVLKRIFQAFYADPQFRNMLVDEAHIAMSLNHSNIVQVLDLGEADGQYVLALELVDGWTLDAVLRRARALNTTLPPALALYVTAEVCRALAYAHAKTDADGRPLGIVHRDTSPHNVLLSEQGEVKLTDFGIATARNKRESSLGNIIKGKIAYMSPEQASGGALDSRSDLFSVGTMLYVMICRRYPFDAQTDLEVLLLVKNGAFVPPEIAGPGLNPELYRVLNRAMAKAPGDRYQRAEDMLVDVEQVMRVAFHPVGQTELKRWLQDLSSRDGAPPLTRAPLFPAPAGETEGDALVAAAQDSEMSPPSHPTATLPPPAALPSTPGNMKGSTPPGVATDSARKSRPPPPPAALAVGKRAATPHESFESIPGAVEPNQTGTRADDALLPNEEPSEGAQVSTQVSKENGPEASREEGSNQAVPEAIPQRVTGRQVASRTRSNRIAAQVPTMESALPPPSPRKSSSWVAEAVLAAAGRAGSVAPPPVGPAVPPPVPMQQPSFESHVAPARSEPEGESKRRPRGIWVAMGAVLVLAAGLSVKMCGGKPTSRQEARLPDTKTAAGAKAVSQLEAPQKAAPIPRPSAGPQDSPAGPTPGATELANPAPGNAGGSAVDASEGAALAAGRIPPKGSPQRDSGVAVKAPSPGAPTGAGDGAEGESAGENDDPEQGAENGGRSEAVLDRRVPVLLRSTPPGALVATAHRSFGSTPVEARFKVGRAYALTFTRDGYAPVTKHFRVTNEENQEIVAKLRKAGPQSDGDQTAPPASPKASQRPWFQRMFGR